jgi:hypothetical protein
MKHVLRQFFYLFLFTTLCTTALAQDFAAYRSTRNPQYWKNRKPDAAYWQQDVHYTIDARIDETAHTITASQTLEYVNNSPDTLTYVFFHMYQNAFVKGSYFHDLEEAVGVKARLGKYEGAGLGIAVENLKVDGQDVKTEMDNTILKVYLPRPLRPNGSISFKMDFKTYWDNGSTRRRMKMYNAWGFMHYNGVQWFPKMCVYDRKFGWDTYQHMGKEFYGDFGVWDISLDFASNYIVEATGMLQNRKEVLPDDLREKLDVKNFASKPWDEKPSIIIPYNKDERKTWKYHAENVHDFAFTADPSYRLSTAYWNGIECGGIVQEPHASGWQKSGELVAKIIETFSNDIGMYVYPKMVAADAADGMEYPMLTLDGGAEPGYRGLLVHEIGHNWFYGMVGSNETYRAAMDEGFTQFLTAWGLNRIDGKYIKEELPKSKYRRKFYEPKEARDQRVFNYYMQTALQGEDRQLNTHSNDFDNALHHEGGYGLVYYKTATMLYNLQYVLGDSLFHAAFAHYFDQWKMAHPYFEDFRASIIQYTKVDLNWFFDQWLETTKNIDYSIDYTKRVRGTDSFEIRLRRRGDMQMPIDFTITQKDGTKQDYHIPNTPWFMKSTQATVLPKWFGWGKLRDTYTARVAAPSGLRYVQIDTSERLTDIYPLDNSKAHNPFMPSLAFKAKFDGGLSNPTDRRHYRLYIRPDLWYNPVDGIKAGLHFEGDFMKTMHRMDAAVWWNTHLLQSHPYQPYKSEGWYERHNPVNFTFSYASPISLHMPKHEEEFQVRLLDGLHYVRLGHVWKPMSTFNIRGYLQFMNRGDNSYNLDYLLYRNEWSSTYKRPNNSVNIEVTRSLQKGKVSLSSILSLCAPVFTGNEPNAFNYSYLQYEQKGVFGIHKLELRTRLFARIGTGSSVPYESALWLAGANPEQLMDNKYTRSIGFVPDEWRGISRYEPNHFQQGGGMNLRGYAGYFVADTRDGDLYIGYKGRSGAAINIEADIDNYINLKPRFTRNWLHMDVYGFFDGGMIELSRINSLAEYQNSTPTEEWSDIRVDAGVGFALTVKKWGALDKASPLTLRFDMPLFLNRPPYADPQYATFRYVVGINRTF